jgi:hypothetical protein
MYPLWHEKIDCKQRIPKSLFNFAVPSYRQWCKESSVTGANSICISIVKKCRNLCHNFPNRWGFPSSTTCWENIRHYNFSVLLPHQYRQEMEFSFQVIRKCNSCQGQCSEPITMNRFTENVRFLTIISAEFLWEASMPLYIMQMMLNVKTIESSTYIKNN